MSKDEFRPNPVKAKITILSPIHIGTGEEVTRAELAVKGNVIYRTSLEKLYKNENYGFIDSLIKRAIEEPTKPLEKLQECVLKYPIYRIATLEEKIELKLLYNEIIKTQNKMYIPGSSIKGAFLTAVINHVIKKIYYESQYSMNFYKFLKKNVTRPTNKKSFSTSLINIALLWLINPNKLMRIKNFNDTKNFKISSKQWIQISDTETISPEKGGIVRRVSRAGSYSSLVSEADRLKDINFEAFRNNISLSFTMQTLKDCKVSTEEILKIVNEFYQDRLKEEQIWLNDKKIPSPSSLVKSLKEKEFLLRLGFGSGNLSTSIISTIKEIADSEQDEYLLTSFGREWKPTRSLKPDAQTKWLVRFKPKNSSKFMYYTFGWGKIALDSN